VASAIASVLTINSSNVSLSVLFDRPFSSVSRRVSAVESVSFCATYDEQNDSSQGLPTPVSRQTRSPEFILGTFSETHRKH
jgi:hypothetical protein